MYQVHIDKSLDPGICDGFYLSLKILPNQMDQNVRQKHTKPPKEGIKHAKIIAPEKNMDLHSLSHLSPISMYVSRIKTGHLKTNPHLYVVLRISTTTLHIATHLKRVSGCFVAGVCKAENCSIR